MIKNKLKFRCTILALFFIVLIYDTLITFNKVPYLIVNDAYVKDIFAAIATVGVLGSTILSTVLSISDVTCLGFSLKEILRFSSSPIRIQRILMFSIGPIIIAMIILAFEFCTTMSFILVFTVIYIIWCSIQTWKLISAKDLLNKLVIAEVKLIVSKGSLRNLACKVSRWGKEIKDAIENGDEELQDFYMELLNLVYKAKNEPGTTDLSLKIENIVIQAFPIAVNYYGFSMAYQKFFRIDDNMLKYNEVAAIRKYISSIRYGNTEKLGSLDIAGKINNIIYDLSADENNVIFVLFQFYDAIYSNPVIKYDLKRIILSDYFKNLTHFSDAAKNIEAQSQAVQYCFREGVLKNPDNASRVKLFELITNNLYRNNSLMRSDKYIRTIADIFRGAFFYTEYEAETVRKEHRAAVKDTVTRTVDTIDNMVIKLSAMIKEHSNKIIDYYIDDACNNDFGGIYDYFPNGFGCKSTIWTSKSRIQFAFMYYLIEGYDHYLFPLQSIFKSTNIDNSKKISICISIMELYNITTLELGEYAIDTLGKLQESLDTNDLLPQSYIKDNFEYVNSKLIELRGDNIPAIQLNLDVEVIQEQLEKQIAEVEKLSLNKALVAKSESEFQIPPHFNRYKTCYKDIANDLRMAVNKAITQILKDTLREVKVSFDQNGVNTLLHNLKSDDIKIRNYTFVDDLALRKEVRATSEFIELENIIRKTKLISYNEIEENIFLKAPLSLNVQVVSYISELPSAEQCDLYLKNHKIVDGRFYLDNSLCTTQQAVEWVRKNIRVESAVFKVALSIDANSGFRIKFDRKK